MATLEFGIASSCKPQRAMLRGMTRRKKILVATGIVLALAAAVQCTTYCLFAERAMPRAGLRSLYDYSIIAKRKFVLVEQLTWQKLSEVHQAELAAELTKDGQELYRAFDDLPESALMTEPLSEEELAKLIAYRGTLDASREESIARLDRTIASKRRLVGFTDGIEVAWSLDASGLFWMRCSSSHYVGSTGAEHGTDVFVWLLWRWVRVYSFGHSMA
ncbi:MAG: hypothetical protein L6R28_14730 [Planctomycetes bacterium]|nr:hypothetical protein [Planctomycetota bacterium]